VCENGRSSLKTIRPVRKTLKLPTSWAVLFMHFPNYIEQQNATQQIAVRVFRLRNIFAYF
jgi:hypothetical protein